MHPERRMKIDSIRFDAGIIHPLSLKIYGKPKPSKELLASIEKVGLLQPLIINETDKGHVLLVGNTRREAWRLLHEQGKVKTIWIPCRFVKVSVLEAEQFVIESNQQREKTEGQKVLEASELLRIESELAKQRQLLGRKDPSRAPGKGKASKIVAEKMGWGEDKVRQASAIAESKTALASLDEGKSVSQVYKELRKKSPQKINESATLARELTKLFTNGEVSRSKKDGMFHLTLKDRSEKQIREISKVI